MVRPAQPRAGEEAAVESTLLLQAEDSLVQELVKCSPDKRFHLRLQLSKFREKMMNIPALESIRELRNGAAVSLKSLGSLFGERTDVLCVDWVAFNDSFMMFTVRPGEDPLMHKLDIKSNYLRNWNQN